MNGIKYIPCPACGGSGTEYLCCNCPLLRECEDGELSTCMFPCDLCGGDGEVPEGIAYEYEMDDLYDE